MKNLLSLAPLETENPSLIQATPNLVQDSYSQVKAQDIVSNYVS
jgi:hypothetical protein